MTKRTNPATTAPTVEVETVETVEATDLDLLTAAVDLDGDDLDRIDSNVVAVVREFPNDRRADLITAVAIASAADPRLAVVIPMIAAAPFGPDPSTAVIDRIGRAVDGLARYVLGAAESVEGMTVDRLDIGGMFAAALNRVEPMTAVEVEAVTAPTTTAATSTGRRTRQTVARSWSTAAGVYTTPGRNGLGRNLITVEVGADGNPTFLVNATAERFASPTAALRAADGWQTGETGWGSPFAVCRRLDGPHAGRTLGDLTTV